MLGSLEIKVDPEKLNEGSPEERACFAALTISFGAVLLTEGYDEFINKVRSAPLLSSYHLAEWIAWNWWRLRWEPRTPAPDWAFAHRMASIGEGYVWPDITVFSDGQRVALLAKPTPRRPNTRFRYLSETAAVVRAEEFEYTMESFIEQVRGLLREQRITESNLDRIWSDVQEERKDPGTFKQRKWEALLGCDPDEGDPTILRQLLEDAQALGEESMNEVAANVPNGGRLLSLQTLRDEEKANGYDADPKNMVRLADRSTLPNIGEVAAWRLGAEAARALRKQERFGSGPISNDRLAGLAGIDPKILSDKSLGATFSFALDQGRTSRVVLRSPWETSRRFELARLLGDRLLAAGPGRLFLASRAYTYRQKMQRSFAAEFLSPFESLDPMLGGDYSPENQERAAHGFNVSEWTIRTLLVNHNRLGRDDIDDEIAVS